MFRPVIHLIHFRTGLPLLLLFPLVQCSVHPYGPAQQAQPSQAGIPCENLRVELINWRTKGTKPLGAHLVQVLRNSRGSRKVVSTKVASFETKADVGSGPVMGIQIIREAYPGNMTLGGQLEERPTRHVAQIVNNSIAISSGFVIPVFPHFERKITFRVRRSGRHVKSYSYFSNYRVVLGWVALLLLPWSESDYIKKDLTRLGNRFMADAKKDGVFAKCGERAHAE